MSPSSSKAAMATRAQLAQNSKDMWPLQRAISEEHGVDCAFDFHGDFPASTDLSEVF